jgi:hypothetical protein
MLLKVGLIMMVVALVLTAGVTGNPLRGTRSGEPAPGNPLRGTRSGEPAPATTPTEPLAVETKTRENKPNLGEKLEIDEEEPNEKLAADDGPTEKPRIDSEPETNDSLTEKMP